MFRQLMSLQSLPQLTVTADVTPIHLNVWLTLFTLFIETIILCFLNVNMSVKPADVTLLIIFKLNHMFPPLLT